MILLETQVQTFKSSTQDSAFRRLYKYLNFKCLTENYFPCKISLIEKLLLNLNEDKYRCMINAVNAYFFYNVANFHGQKQLT